MKQPEISVIIPCYNQEKYIQQCLDSIINQTYKNFEIIAVDDGSKDSTLEILKNYEKQYENITVLTQKNLSAGVARNYGLTKACGKYVLFMDSDDFLDENAFDVLHAITEKEVADIYFYNFRTYDDQTGDTVDKSMFDNLGKAFSCDSGEYRYATTSFKDRKEFFVWSYVAPWNKLYNREFVVSNALKFDEIFSTNDRTFYFSSLVKSESIVTLDACLINYRINNSDSLTGTYNENKFNNRKYAYESSSRWIDREDSVLRETFFKVTVLDFVSFYQKADADNKYRVFVNTMNFFKSIDVDNIMCVNDPNDQFGFYYNFFVQSEYLLSWDKNKIVPVVFATNDKYLPYLGVALESLIENSSKDNFYDVYVFHSGLSELNKIKICNMSTPNIHVRVVDVNCLVKNLPLYAKSHFSVEMYYRILISELLWQYNKVLYLDCDIVVNIDVAQMYKIELGGNILAVVRNLLDTDMYKYVTNALKMQEELYFNSGILIIDTNLFKQNDIKNQCFEILAKYQRLACPDQDILNLSCLGKCLYLDETWNFQTGNHSYSTAYKYEILNDIKIIHYTTGHKPWNTQGLPLSEFFWKYARNTPFYEDIVLTYISSTMKLDSLVLKSGAQEQQRNLINDKNQMHYKVINPYAPKDKLLITWPFRMFVGFFASWRRYGFKVTVKKVPIKLKYVVNRILGRVDKNNNYILNKKSNAKKQISKSKK